MNTNKSQNGFSLVELVLAVAITVSSALVILGVFALSLDAIADSKDDAVAMLMADSVKSRVLSDQEWPVPSSTAKPVTTNVYFNESGIMVADADQAKYVGEINITDSPNYPSKRLDFIVMEVYRGTTSTKPIETFSFQRFLEEPRP